MNTTNFIPPARFSRTSGAAFRDADYGTAFWPHEKPATSLRSVIRYVMAGLLVIGALLLFAACSGPSDTEDACAQQLSLQDALAQAQRERPDLWTPETIERAQAAALIAAAGLK